MGARKKFKELPSRCRTVKTITSSTPVPGVLIGMMALRSNIPTAMNEDWKLTTCPECGRECWYQINNAKILKDLYCSSEVRFLCTECALKSRKVSNMALIDMIKNYQALLDRKDDLSEQTKANNAAIEAAKAEITQQMVDEDIPRISTGGYCFTLTAKTSYTKRSEEELAEGGLDFLDVLREEGLGDIIVEKVDPRTLQSTIKDYVEEHGELSEALDSVIRSYEYNDITRRKESAGRKKK